MSNVVINASERLSLSLGDDYEDIIDYFEETYIDLIKQDDSPSLVLIFGICSIGQRMQPRTNNVVEAYHRRISSVFQSSHPTLWSFLEKLIEEENATHIDILHINADQAPKLNSKRNERFEKRLLNIISNRHADGLKQLDSRTDIISNISL
ncbi:unnamed protein product [Didymodactylos carnosus]|uniref:Uncharacterized protein n=1 Tax=Didymodactylos carnosus TaxID=1234261 RepID=A0A8S2FW16_9BILA|nr:unnamed protein product [Didymodactylos carnosus]CAF4366324.1 unnamed protein product [Didymodactylos carnosus]